MHPHDVGGRSSEVELFIEPVWTVEKGFWSNEYPNDLLLPS
ncbi:hypothetical protein AB0L26_03560 [Streptomyces nondiastaticus]